MIFTLCSVRAGAATESPRDGAILAPEDADGGWYCLIGTEEVGVVVIGPVGTAGTGGGVLGIGPELEVGGATGVGGGAAAAGEGAFVSAAGAAALGGGASPTKRGSM